MAITDKEIREVLVTKQRELSKTFLATTGLTSKQIEERSNQMFRLSGEVYSARVALGERRARRGDSRAKARARCAEMVKALAEAFTQCDFHDAHDTATDRPAGNRCRAQATHRIEWADGRFSLGCDAHLEIDDTATVKPIAITPIRRTA